MNSCPPLRLWFCLILSAGFSACIQPGGQPAVPKVASPPVESMNVLFISIDDLNDWIGPFGGHPQATTPHMDRFAEQGAFVFQNAHCAGPVCGPSRSALLSGFMPNRTGAYGNAHQMLYSDLVQTHATLPEYFAKHGYHTLSRGKIFHAHGTENGFDRGQWAFEDWSEGTGSNRVIRNRLTSRRDQLINGEEQPSPYSRGAGSPFAWGPTQQNTAETRDYQAAQWAADQIQDGFNKPFFLALGISKPHLTWFVPQEFFDRFDLETLEEPPYRLDDLDDITTPDGEMKFEPSNDFLWTTTENLYREATRAYLAASSYADTCVGVVLNALEQSPYADNTIVVIWGDHGWHLGEKLRYRKAALWVESTRLPLMIRLPGQTERQDTVRPVNLVDLFPTLIELCGLPEKPELDGRSLVPLMDNPQRAWPYPAITIRGVDSASVRDEIWSYIRYEDGTEELYHRADDPHEWTNLMHRMTPEAEAARSRLASHIPTEWAEPLPTYPSEWKNRSRGYDETLKASRDLKALK